jgi:polyhydroxyalkanoate synthesis regulator phasin
MTDEHADWPQTEGSTSGSAAESAPETAPKAPEPPTAEGRKMPSPPKPSELAELMEKVFMMGVGAASLTKEKFDALADELVERGKVSRGEAKEVADWMSTQAKQQAKAVETTFSRTTDSAVSEAGVATKKDIEALQEQVLELKAMIASSRGVSGSADQS